MDIKNVSQLLKANISPGTKLFEGSTITGKILTNENGKGTIKLYDGSIIPAIFISENDAQKDKPIKFIIQSFDGENFVLKMVGENEDIKSQKSLNTIIRDLNIPFDEGKAIIMSLIKYNLPANNENINNLYKNLGFLNNLKNMSDSEILLFLHEHLGENITENSAEFMQTKTMFSELKNVDLDFLTFMLENDSVQNPQNIIKTQDFMKNKFFFNSFIDNVKSSIPNINGDLRTILSTMKENSTPIMSTLDAEAKNILSNIIEPEGEVYPHFDGDVKSLLTNLVKDSLSTAPSSNINAKNDMLNILKEANNMLDTIKGNENTTLTSIDKGIKNLIVPLIKDLNTLLPSVISLYENPVNPLPTTEEKSILTNFLKNIATTLEPLNNNEKNLQNTMIRDLAKPLSNFIDKVNQVIQNIDLTSESSVSAFNNSEKNPLLELLNNGNNTLLDITKLEGTSSIRINNTENSSLGSTNVQMKELIQSVVKELYNAVNSNSEDLQITNKAFTGLLTGLLNNANSILPTILENDNSNSNSNSNNVKTNSNIKNTLSTLIGDTNNLLSNIPDNNKTSLSNLTLPDKNSLLKILNNANSSLSRIGMKENASLTPLDKNIKNYLSNLIKDSIDKLQNSNEGKLNVLPNENKDAKSLLTSFIDEAKDILSTSPTNNDSNNVSNKEIASFIKNVNEALSNLDNNGNNVLSKFIKLLGSKPSTTEKLLIDSVIQNFSKNTGLDKTNIKVTSLEEAINIFKNNKDMFSFISTDSYNKLLDKLDTLKQINTNYNLYYFNLYDGSNIFKNNIIIKNKYKGSKHIDINDVKAFITVDTQHIGKVESNIYKKNNDVSIAFSVKDEFVPLFKNNLSILKNSLKEFGYNIVNISVSKAIKDNNILPFSDFFNDTIFRELDVKV